MDEHCANKSLKFLEQTPVKKFKNYVSMAIKAKKGALYGRENENYRGPNGSKHF